MLSSLVVAVVLNFTLVPGGCTVGNGLVSACSSIRSWLAFIRCSAWRVSAPRGVRWLLAVPGAAIPNGVCKVGWRCFCWGRAWAGRLCMVLRVPVYGGASSRFRKALGIEGFLPARRAKSAAPNLPNFSDIMPVFSSADVLMDNTSHTSSVTLGKPGFAVFSSSRADPGIGRGVRPGRCGSTATVTNGKYTAKASLVATRWWWTRLVPVAPTSKVDIATGVSRGFLFVRWLPRLRP